MKPIALIVATLIPLGTLAAPNCKTATRPDTEAGDIKVEICIKQIPMQYDVYTLKINGEKVVEDIDDKVLQFSGRYKGKALTGGCTPNNEMQELGGMKIPVEVSRTCKVVLEQQEIAVLEFKFD
ncbi:hypothetical protein [Chitinimonas naiadis]